MNRLFKRLLLSQKIICSEEIRKNVKTNKILLFTRKLISLYYGMIYENILNLHYRKKKKKRTKIVSCVFVEMILKNIYRYDIIMSVPRDKMIICI